MAFPLMAVLAVASAAASALKGKKQEYAAQQTPQQLALMNYLINLGKGNVGQGAANKRPTYDAMNMISRMFGGGLGHTDSRTRSSRTPEAVAVGALLLGFCHNCYANGRAINRFFDA